MSDHLLLSFRFLSPWFHGRGDDGEPEWPPSPLRAFQALVAAAARAGTLESTRAALQWLEQRPPPLVVASDATKATSGYRLSVPHNAMDLVARQWARGDEGNASEHRAMKNVRPHRLPEDGEVHYAWALAPGEGRENAEGLIAAARNVVALGWGIDLIVGDGALIDGARLVGLAREPLKTWEPRVDGEKHLRAPVGGTLGDLARRHEAFLGRTSLADPTLRPPPALSTFAITRYARSDERPRPRVATFTLMHVESDSLRAFDTARKGMVVAGMLRHALRTAAERAGWTEERVRGTVLGHGDGQEPRLLLVPVPSIEWRQGRGEVVTAVRRALVLSTDARSQDVVWAERSLGGAELIDEDTGRCVALLAASAPEDRALRRYLDEAVNWATVTPVVLPGLDDPGGLRERLRHARNAAEQKQILERLTRRREGLVRKSLRQAGFAEELVFGAQVETREVGFFAGLERASRYAVPQHLKPFPRFHARITWAKPVAGPLCVGRGRFSGLGLFASHDD